MTFNKWIEVLKFSFTVYIIGGPLFLLRFQQISFFPKCIPYGASGANTADPCFDKEAPPFPRRLSVADLEFGSEEGGGGEGGYLNTVVLC